MDTKNLQVAAPSTSALTKYTFKRPFWQCFSLPYPIIKYMVLNPQSGKVWKKLILSCKYFYPKYPVFPVETLRICGLEYEADGEAFDLSKPFPKLWLYDSFTAVNGSDISPVISKIFKFDLHDLHLLCQSLTFQDYQKLTSSGSFECLHLIKCTIKNDDGTTITADKLFENLQHLERFRLMWPDPLMFQPDTVKNMVKHLNRFKNMRSFTLFAIEETFDFRSFVGFLMKNQTVFIRLSFPHPVSAAYKEMIENVVQEIQKNSSLNVPVVEFLHLT